MMVLLAVGVAAAAAALTVWWRNGFAWVAIVEARPRWQGDQRRRLEVMYFTSRNQALDYRQSALKANKREPYDIDVFVQRAHHTRRKDV